MDENEKKYLDGIWHNLSQSEKKEFNSLSESQKSVWLRHYSEDESMAENAEEKSEQQNEIVCKDCKYARKLFSGKTATGWDGHPAYMAGSCEKYEIKPTGVYFDGDKCSKYAKK